MTCTRPRTLWFPLVLGVALATVASLLPACNSHPLAGPQPTVGVESTVLQTPAKRKLDLLFVIDNSRSMEQEQASLIKNFPAFMNELAKIRGGLPDLHLAVISSDVGAGGLDRDTCRGVGDGGRFLAKGGCGLDSGARFLSVAESGAKNFAGALPETFACIAQLGTQGCGYEHQLMALSLALSPHNQAWNTGFLRKDALLGIVLLSDEDDCSAEPSAAFFREERPGESTSLRCNTLGHVCGDSEVPAAEWSAPLASCRPYRSDDDGARNRRLINVRSFADYVRAAKGDPEQIIVSGIIGWDDSPGAQYRIVRQVPEGGGAPELQVAPACRSSNGTAAPAIRLKSFLESFKYNSRHSICEGDLKDAMTKIGKAIGDRLSNICLPAPPVDTDPAREGVQPECVVVDRRSTPTGPVETTLPPCADGKRPCWELIEGGKCKHGEIRIDRGGQEPPPDVVQAVSCFTTDGADPSNSAFTPAGP